MHDIEGIAETYNTKLVADELNYDKLLKPPPFDFHVYIPSDVEQLTVSGLMKRDIATEWAVRFYKTTEFEINNLSVQFLQIAENICHTHIEKLQSKVVERMKHLRQELEKKQKDMESLNQKTYLLETVHRQLLVVREEFQFADKEEEKPPVVEVKKVKVEEKKLTSSRASSQPHFCHSVITL